MKDDISTPTPDESPNEFERDKAGTAARNDAEAAIEDLRQRGGVFVEAVRATRMPMALTDPNLPGNPIVFANQSFLRLSGYSMDEVLGQKPHFMNGPETDGRDAARFSEAIRADHDDIIETVQYRKNGSRFVATVLISGFKDDKGRTLNHFMSWLDVTRRVDAEDEVAELQRAQILLRESQARLAATFESVPAGLAAVDPDGRTIMANAHYRRFVPAGIVPSRDPDQRARWKAWDEEGHLLDPRDYPAARALRGETVSAGQEMLFADDDGREIWTNVASAPTFDEQGRVTGVVTTISDIDRRKRAELALQESERHAQTLLAELQHRVRNTLAVVRSIARRTGETTGTAEEMLAHLEGRLDAFSRVQSAVIRSPEGTVDLKSLVEDELVAHAAREGEQIRMSGEEVILSPKAAERMSLAIHELVTNAVKHGALISGDGTVAISWSKEQAESGEQLNFVWKEGGVAIGDGRTIEREGFGMELLRRTLVFDLDARTEVCLEPDGLRFDLVLPLSGHTERA